MKRIICISLAYFFVLIGCSMHHRAIYEIKLREVNESLLNQDIRGVSKQCFEDSLIKIIWEPTSEKIYLNLYNKSNQSIQIQWPKAVFLDINGKSHRVAYSDIDFKSKSFSQEATSILKNSSMSFAVLPADYIIIKKKNWQSRYAERSEKYKTIPLLPNQSTVFSSSDKLWEKAKNYREKTFGLMLPISDKLNNYEYTFTFEITDAYIRPAE